MGHADGSTHDRAPTDASRDPLLDVLLAQPGVGVAVYDRDLRYVRVNETLAAFHGVPAVAHVGRTLAELSSTLFDQTGPLLREVLASGEPRLDVDLTAPGPGTDQRRAWRASYLPLRDGSGAVSGVVVVVADVTARRRAEERLRLMLEASRVLNASLDYEATLASLARLLVPALADGCTIDVAEPGEPPRTLAHAHVDPAKDALGLELRARFPPAADASHGLTHVLRTGRPEVTTRLAASSGDLAADAPEHRRMVEALGVRSQLIVPMIARGRTVGAMTLVSTRDELRYRDEDLPVFEELALRAALALDNARLYRDAQEANRTKDEFLGTVSHELRTPLTAILGWAHILRKKRRDDPELGRGLAIIERNAKTQAQIIEDILDVSRIISGKLRIDLKPLDVRPSLRAALDVVRPGAEAREIKLELEIADELGEVLADADRLQQVVWNLLSNAVKFTPKGGTITVRAERVGSSAKISVRDTGKGIAPEFLPHVFERFQQADSSTSRAHAGLGLGLSIVRHIVELHGGAVRAESAGRGKGATFSVEVPLHVAAAPGEGRASVPLLPADGPRLDGMRVLVVDDEPDARELIAMVLADQGATVTTAASAEEAMLSLVRAPPDVLVSDIGMPGEDGYALIRRVRALKEDVSRLPAIALTAYARADDARKAFLAGFHMHVAKPVEPKTLVGVVFDLGGRGETSRED